MSAPTTLVHTTIHASCGCGFATKSVREAIRHAEKTGHQLELRGTINGGGVSRPTGEKS